MYQLFGRMVRPLAALALSAAFLSPGNAGAQTAPPGMVGNWTAPPGGTISKAIISAAGAGYLITIEAPCTPSPCAWGTRALTIYAPGVTSHAGYLGSATFQQGFVMRTVIVSMQNATAPFLRVQVLSHFSGAGGGRSNYATTQVLHP